MNQKRKINDERGFVAHILKNTDPSYFTLTGGIAEVYASLCYPGQMKGWHYHHRMNMVYTCVQGIAQVVVADPSLDEMRYRTHFIGEGVDACISIPAQTWNAFRAVGNTPCLIINCTDMVHDPEEIMRKRDIEMDYKWDQNI